jgi:CO dehydrogenase maturation factor
VATRGEAAALTELPAGARALGTLPDDELVRAFDRAGRSLWELPGHAPARQAAREVARQLAGPRAEGGPA